METKHHNRPMDNYNRKEVIWFNEKNNVNEINEESNLILIYVFLIIDT